jgi:uncharacterized membrane protein
MKGKVKFVCLVLAVLVFSATTAACAATFTFTNDLDLRIAITMAYYDANSGALTTRGWWHVGPGGQTSVSVNADTSRDVYFAAYNRVQYFDSSTRGNPTIRRLASRNTFRFTTETDPAGHYDVWEGRYFRINGQSVRIDARR